MPKIDWNEPPYIVQRDLIVHDWSLYGRLLRFHSANMAISYQEWDQAISEEADKILDTDARSDFYEYHTEEHEDRVKMRDLLMYNFFSNCFTLFEDHLLKICSYAKSRTKSRYSVDDLEPESAVERSRMYLIKLGIDFPSGTPEWDIILEYEAIISNRKSKAQYMFNHEFCDVALTNFKEFVLKVHQAYVDGTG